jgi:hypothetical protein
MAAAVMHDNNVWKVIHSLIIKYLGLHLIKLYEFAIG